jgi:hypothetical protein
MWVGEEVQEVPWGERVGRKKKAKKCKSKRVSEFTSGRVRRGGFLRG